MQERLMRFEKMLVRDLETEIDKIEKSGTLSPDNIKLLKDAFKLKKLVKECTEEEGYSSRRGRDPMTGRYVSRDYMSRDGSYDDMSRGSFGSYNGSYDGSYRGSYADGYSGHQKMIQHLERMYDEAEDEKERQMISEWMRKAKM